MQPIDLVHWMAGDDALEIRIFANVNCLDLWLKMCR